MLSHPKWPMRMGSEGLRTKAKAESESEEEEMIRKIPWDEYDDYGELYGLKDLVESGWDWQWPGWPWVADALNMEFKNNRTANACRLKYDRYKKESE